MYNGEDRVKQVNAIDEIAQSLTSTGVTVDDYDGNKEAYIAAIVYDWLDNVALPEWWDDHDTGLLRDRVRKYTN